MSPHGLVQEWLERDALYPWRMLVCCILLNKTTGAQAVPVAMEVLETWPTPLLLANAIRVDLQNIVRPCGLWRRRSLMLKAMSAAFSRGAVNPAELPGVGDYALDSWTIFVDGRLPKSVGDGKLRLYLSWARRNRAQFEEDVVRRPVKM